MDQSISNDNRLFPTRASFFVFWSYISLFVSQGLLFEEVQRSQIYGFNTVVVVSLTELVKLLICVFIYLMRSQGSTSRLIYDLNKNRRLLLLYLVPAFLYCLYNNLTYINMSLLDLTTYYCLMQFRIVLTAVIYQILFRRKLTAIQWTSLIILTSGCLLKEYGMYNNVYTMHNDSVTTHNTTESNITISHSKSENMAIADDYGRIGSNPLVNFAWLSMLLLLQMFCSCFAGVYNEYLLKDSSTANDTDVILQNMYMYIDSILCNLIVFKLTSSPNNGLTSSPLLEDKPTTDISVLTIMHNLLTNPLVIVLIFNNALSGLVASFFLKSLNSILKTFASALELFAVAFLAWILFDNEVDMYTVVALFLVSAAMIVYSKNPVSVAPPSRSLNNKDGFMLIPTSEEQSD